MALLMMGRPLTARNGVHLTFKIKIPVHYITYVDGWLIAYTPWEADTEYEQILSTRYGIR